MARNYNATHPNKSKERWQKNKNNIAWRARLKKWLAVNRAKVKKKQAIRGRKWHEKHCNGITENYARFRLKSQYNGLTDAEITPEMIELKRAEILYHRIRTEIVKTERDVKQTD